MYSWSQYFDTNNSEEYHMHWCICALWPPALWYFMLVCNVLSNSASRQWGPDGRHAERGLAAADRGHHHPPRFLRCYGAAGTETGVPQVLEGQLWLCLWSANTVAESFSVWDRSSSSTWGSVVAVCGQRILLHNHWNTWRSVVTVFVVSEYWFLTEAGIPQVREGQLWLCLWSKHAVAGPFSVMEQQELGQEFLQWLNLVCGQCMRLQKNPLLWWRSGTRVPQVFVGLLMLC